MLIRLLNKFYLEPVITGFILLSFLLYQQSPKFLGSLFVVVIISTILNIFFKSLTITFSMSFLLALCFVDTWNNNTFYPLQLMNSSLLLTVASLLLVASVFFRTWIFFLSYVFSICLCGFLLSLLIGVDPLFWAGPDITPFGILVLVIFSKQTFDFGKSIKMEVILGITVAALSLLLRFNGFLFSTVLALAIIDIFTRVCPNLIFNRTES